MRAECIPKCYIHTQPLSTRIQKDCDKSRDPIIHVHKVSWVLLAYTLSIPNECWDWYDFLSVTLPQVHASQVLLLLPYTTTLSYTVSNAASSVLPLALTGQSVVILLLVAILLSNNTLVIIETTASNSNRFLSYPVAIHNNTPGSPVTWTDNAPMRK